MGTVKEGSLEAPRERFPEKEREKVTLVSGRLRITAHRLSPLKLENASIEQLGELVWVLRMPEASGKTLLARLVHSSQSPVDRGLDVETYYEITVEVGSFKATTAAGKAQRAGKLLGRIYAQHRGAAVEDPVYDLLVYSIPAPVYRDLLSTTARQKPWGDAIEVYEGEDKREMRAIAISKLLDKSVEGLKKAFKKEGDRAAVKHIDKSIREACGVAQEFFKEYSTELASGGKTSILTVRNCRILIRDDIAFDPPRDPAQLSESEKAVVGLVLQVAAAYFLGKLMEDQSIIENRRKFLAVADIAIHDPKMLLAVYTAIKKTASKHREVFQNAVEGFILMHRP